MEENIVKPFRIWEKRDLLCFIFDFSSQLKIILQQKIIITFTLCKFFTSILIGGFLCTANLLSFPWLFQVVSLIWNVLWCGLVQFFLRCPFPSVSFPDLNHRHLHVPHFFQDPGNSLSFRFLHFYSIVHWKRHIHYITSYFFLDNWR